MFRSPRGGRGAEQPQSPFSGKSGKFYKYLFKKISGFDLPENGADVNEVLYISPQQAREGGPYAYYLKKTKKKLVVKIPPGIKEGQKIRLAGMGEEGKGGGTAGDLYLKVHLTKPLFQSVKDLVLNIKKTLKR